MGMRYRIYLSMGHVNRLLGLTLTGSVNRSSVRCPFARLLNTVPPSGTKLSVKGPGDTERCWNCRTEVHGTFFCPATKCGVLLEPSSRNSDYFSLFNLPVRFDVDLEALDRTYKAMQRQLHPDRFSNKSEVEQRFSLSHAARLNEAYSILKDPYLRALYLLRRQGQKVDEEGETITDPELLTQVLETREAIAMASSEEELRAIERRVSEQSKQIEQQLASAFSRGDLDAARAATRHLSYLRRITEALREKLPSL